MIDNKQNQEEALKSFDQLDLKNDLLRGISSYGLPKPSTIQEKTILSILKGKDTIIQAQSGSGKTTALAISLLQLIDPKVQKCQALVLTHNRDAVNNIQKLIMSLGEYLQVSVSVCIGGLNRSDQIKKLQEGPQIVVGTPGRVIDMFHEEVLKVEDLKIIVLEEVDAIYKMGFSEEIKAIYKLIPENVQSVLSSVELPPKIMDFTKGLMKDPEIIFGEKEDLVLNEIEQLKIKEE